MEITETDLKQPSDGQVRGTFNAADYNALDLVPLQKPADSYIAQLNAATVKLFGEHGFKSGEVVKVDGCDWIILGFNGCAYYRDDKEGDPLMRLIAEDPSTGIQRYMTLEAIQKENPKGSKPAPIGQRISRTLTGVRRSLRDLFLD